MLKFISYIYLIIFFILNIINFFISLIKIFFLNIINIITLLNINLNFINDTLFYYLNFSIFSIQNNIFKFTMFKYNISNELIYDINYIFGYIIFILQVLFIVIITIWTRAAGPRFRLDQLLSLTWKDLFIYLSLFLIFILVIVVLV